jgi:4-hydroxy-tetrahydrodipicolinate synthase
MNSPPFSTAARTVRDRMSNGLIAATPLPFDQAGRLHARGHRAYLQYVAQQPVAGVAVWAHTGRGLMLDSSTRAQVLRDWRETLPESLIVAGVGSRSNEATEANAQSIQMAEDARELGADALLVYPPTWLVHHPDRDQEILEHHHRLADVGLPLVLFYLYEAAGGISYSPALLDQLLRQPEVVGIKMATLDSVVTYQDVSRRLLEQHPEKLLITGEDRFLGYSLRRGARSALIGMGAVCCELQADLLKANSENNAATFLTLSDTIDQLAEAIFVEPMEGYIKRLLWALVHLGVIPFEAANDPWGPTLPIEEFNALGKTLEATLAVNNRGRR